MKNVLIQFLVVILGLTACGSGAEQVDNQSDKIKISGSVGYPQDGLIVLEEFVNDKPVLRDTIQLQEDYTFNHTTTIEQPGYYRLNFYNKQFVNVILSDSDIQIKVDGNARNGFVEITGSPEINFINRLQRMQREFQSSQEVQQLNSDFQEAAQANDADGMEKLRTRYFELEEELTKKVISAIDSAGASLGVLEILKSGQFLDKDKHYEVYKQYAQRVRKEMPESRMAMAYANEIDAMGKLAIGQIAPDIALPNPDGEIVKLSSLRGNYVLVDFWAKWCKPCRMENPNVVRMYNRFHDKGFEVYGVSLDRKREDWLQAIEQDGLKWTQVSDLKFWKSAAAELYNVKSIPFAILVDPEGRIIGKNLRGQALENKLEEIFSAE